MLKTVFCFLIVAVKGLQLANVKIVQVHYFVSSVTKGYRKKNCGDVLPFFINVLETIPYFFVKNKAYSGETIFFAPCEKYYKKISNNYHYQLSLC